MEGKKPKKVSYIILSKDKINDLESYWGGVEHKCFNIDKMQREEIKTHLKNNIDSIIKVLTKYENNKLTDKIKKELDVELDKLNKYIETINSETKGFKEIKKVIHDFRTNYYDIVGIKTDGKKDITSENGIGLFELFEVEKEEAIEEENEIVSEKLTRQTFSIETSASSSGSRSGSSNSSESNENKIKKEVKEMKEEKSNGSILSPTTSKDKENEMKKVESPIKTTQQTNPEDTPVVTKKNNKEAKKTKNDSCSSARSSSTNSYNEGESQKVISPDIIRYEINKTGKDLKSFGELDKTKNNIGKTLSYSIKDEKNEIKEKIKITKEELFKKVYNTTLYKEITDIDQPKCLQYLKQENYSKQVLEDIILDDRFKDNCLLINNNNNLLINNNNESKINNIFLQGFFINPILNEYKKDHSDSKEIKQFIETIFNVLTNDELKLTEKQKNELNKIKTDCLAKNTIKKESKKTTTVTERQTLTKRDNEDTTNLIVIEDLSSYKDNKTLITKTIDKKLSNYDNNNENKQQLIQNTIDLIKKQKTQLQNDKEKLQKAATLMLLLEVYKININKFNSVNEVYKMLNDTIKKEVKKINDLKTTNVNLNSTISAINSVLSLKGVYKSLDSNSIRF